jgi:hypothetical protein
MPEINTINSDRFEVRITGDIAIACQQKLTISIISKSIKL